MMIKILTLCTNCLINNKKVESEENFLCVLAKRLELVELALKAINVGSERDHGHAERRKFDRTIVQKVCKK